jgi:hypothetical protein
MNPKGKKAGRNYWFTRSRSDGPGARTPQVLLRRTIANTTHSELRSVGALCLPQRRSARVNRRRNALSTRSGLSRACLSQPAFGHKRCTGDGNAACGDFHASTPSFLQANGYRFTPSRAYRCDTRHGRFRIGRTAVESNTPSTSQNRWMGFIPYRRPFDDSIGGRCDPRDTVATIMASAAPACEIA